MKSHLKKFPPKRHLLFRKKLQLFRNKSRSRKVLKKVQKKCQLRKHQSLQKNQSKNKNPHLMKNPLKKPLKSQQWLPRNPLKNKNPQKKNLPKTKRQLNPNKKQSPNPNRRLPKPPLRPLRTRNSKCVFRDFPTTLLRKTSSLTSILSRL